jgi:hypothetical protein
VACLCGVLLIPLHHLLAIALGPANGLLLFPAFSLLAMPLLPAFACHSNFACHPDNVQPAKT